MSERLLTVAIVLFVLSMVCERVSNFLKLGLSDAVWTRFIDFKNLRRSEPSEECEKQRELGILRLNLLCGFLVAVCFGADFNFILGHAGDAAVAAVAANPDHNSVALLGNYLWQPAEASVKTENTVLSRWMGTLLVAFFISFGSKFWHDLIDLLLETKKLRGKLGDQATYQVESAKQLDEYLQLSEGDIVDVVFEQNRDRLLAIPGVTLVGKGQKVMNGVLTPCIAITLKKDVDPRLIPPLEYDLGGGRKKLIAVKVQTGSTAAITAALTITPSSRIGNADVIITPTRTQAAYGSLCFPVYRNGDRNTKLLLTCYHVLRYSGPGGSHPWEGFLPNSRFNQVLLYAKNNIVGLMTEGLRTDTLDVALAEVVDGVELAKVFPGQTWEVRKERWLVRSDPGTTRVQMLGGRSGLKTGIIRERGISAPIDYYDGQPPFTLHGLFTVSDATGPISQPGDSGSLLLDEAGYALGIVVAATDTRTLAVPLAHIFSELHLTF